MKVPHEKSAVYAYATYSTHEEDVQYLVVIFKVLYGIPPPTPAPWHAACEDAERVTRKYEHLRRLG